MRLLVALIGRLLAALPEVFPRTLCAAVGSLVWHGMPGRRRMMLRNLHHAFPARDAAWRTEVGKRTCRRTVEMALFAVASPYFSEERVKRAVTPDGSLSSERDGVLASAPLVACVPHFSLMEALTMTKAVLPALESREVGVFFRPLDNPALDAEVKRSRERFGMKLLSRKDGFREAMEILRRRGVVAVLFDQNAGSPGSLSLLFGRVASTSELAGMLAEKFDSKVVAYWSERTGFWRATVKSERLVESGATSAQIAAAANRWLEKRLSGDIERCADWLWLHSRWKTQDAPERRLRLAARRDITREDFASLGIDGFRPTGDRFVVRLPNWLGDVVMALPLLRAMREARPDTHLTFVTKKAFAPLLEALGIAQEIVVLPERGSGYRKRFRDMASSYVDTWWLFTNSFRGDLEARDAKAKQRFAPVRPGKWRPLLTRGWQLPESLDETRVHQTRVWEKWLREGHGLEKPLDLAPFRPAALVAERVVPNRIGLVCGTENYPAKRWPVAKWRELIGRLLERRPDLEIRLYGTANDLPITREVALGFDPVRVANLAGKTGLVEYCRELTSCAVLACNDTGGMHLANMLGVPVVAIFGPTNPTRTGPVFDARAIVIQPPGCPETGGADIAGVAAGRVAEAVLERV